jgi:hypothetical protein
VTLDRLQTRPSSAEVLDRVRTATPEQVQALVRAYRRALDPYADLMWKQFRAGEGAMVKHRIAEDLELVRRWLGPEASVVTREFEGALGNRAFVHGRADPDIALDRTKRSNDRRLLASVAIPLVAFFGLATVGVVGRVEWLIAPALVALASFIPLVLVVGRLAPSSIQARVAFEGALLAARAQEVEAQTREAASGDEALSTDGSTEGSIDRLLRPYRETFEGLPQQARRSPLDRVSAVLAVGGLVVAMGVIAVGALGSGGRTFTPDAAWSAAFWGALIVMFVGLALAIVSRVLGRSRRRRAG